MVGVALLPLSLRSSQIRPKEGATLAEVALPPSLPDLAGGRRAAAASAPATVARLLHSLTRHSKRRQLPASRRREGGGPLLRGEAMPTRWRCVGNSSTRSRPFLNSPPFLGNVKPTAHHSPVMRQWRPPPDLEPPLPCLHSNTRQESSQHRCQRVPSGRNSSM